MYDVDNALVRQKDAIIALINKGRYEQAAVLLDFTADLWATCGYDYKTRELRERLHREILGEIAHCTHWKTEAKWRQILASC